MANQKKNTLIHTDMKDKRKSCAHTHCINHIKTGGFIREAVYNHFEIVKGDVPFSIWFQQTELCPKIGQFILCQGF